MSTVPPATRRVISASVTLVLLGVAVWVYVTRHDPLLATALAAVGAFAPLILRALLGAGTEDATR